MAIVALTGMIGSELAAPIASVIPGVYFGSPSPAADRLVQPFDIILPNGDVARGWLALPADREPDALVVLCHAFGGTGVDFQKDMEDLAKEGAAVLSMEYRGPVGSFNIEAGVEDTIAATRVVKDLYPSIRTTTIYGFSMGGAVAGITVATMPPDTFDYLVIGAGVVNLSAVWQDIEHFRPAIQDETGGSPPEAPDAYAERSPLAQIEAIATANLTAVVLVHAYADPVTSFEQAGRFYDGLARARVPTLLVAIGGSQRPWACSSLDPVCGANPWATIDSHLVGHTTTVQPVLVGLLGGTWKPATGIVEVDGDDRNGLRRVIP